LIGLEGVFSALATMVVFYALTMIYKALLNKPTVATTGSLRKWYIAMAFLSPIALVVMVTLMVVFAAISGLGGIDGMMMFM
jgi:hypothetical protein